MPEKTTPDNIVLSIPNLKNVKPQITSSAESDGDLIARFLIMDHGFSLKRFVTLSIDQKDYIESTLCTIIQALYNLSCQMNKTH